MPDYNPNAIWGSKEKKYTYAPAGTQPAENAPASSMTGSGPAGETTGATQFNRPGVDDQFGSSPSGAGGAQKPPSFFRRHGLLFFTIGIFFAIGIAAYIYYLLMPAPTPNVIISFSDPGTIVVGQPFPLTITVSNESKSVLQNAELNISLPSGLSFIGSDSADRVLTESIGALSSQTINPPETVQVIAVEDANATQAIAGSAQTVSATLTYQTAATATTQYTNSANTSFTIGTQTALSLSYSAPSAIFSGQNFDIAVNYQNNLPTALSGVELNMDYPPAYHFVASSGTTPVAGDADEWNIGTIAANATGTIIITGNIVGPAQAQYQLTGTIGANFSGQNYAASIAPVNFTVAQSPLTLGILLDNSSTYVATLGDNLTYTITYTNNSDVTFKSVNISAVLVGAMYDFSSLQTTGSFNSQSNSITWNAASAPALAALAPGQSGTLSFTINTKSAFPIRLLSDKNYTLGVTAKAESPTVPPNTAGSNTTSIAAQTNKVGGEITLGADAFYKETDADIANTGPYPPQVNQPTEYTIHWDITNYSTDASSVTLSAYLQSGTTFVGVATSSGMVSTSSVPAYNAGTGLVTWTIPFIPATTGVISPPVQAIFQVTNTPAVNQVGQTVTLLGPTTLTATDEYTGAAVQITAPAVTTELSDDPSAGGQTGDVIQ